MGIGASAAARRRAAAAAKLQKEKEEKDRDTLGVMRVLEQSLGDLSDAGPHTQRHSHTVHFFSLIALLERA